MHIECDAELKGCLDDFSSSPDRLNLRNVGEESHRQRETDLALT